jgi:hypothetical protein
MGRTLLLLWALLGGAIAKQYQLKSSTKIPSEWNQKGRAHPDEIVDVSIGLVQHKFPELEERLLQGRHPVSYGKSTQTHKSFQSLTLRIRTMGFISQLKKSSRSYDLQQGHSLRSKPGWTS